MKQLFAILLAFALTLSGCGGGRGDESRPSMAGNLPSSRGEKRSMPPESEGGAEDNLAYCRKYLEPVYAGSILRVSFGPGEMEAAANAPLIYAFEDLTGGEKMREYWEQYGPSFPREVVEDCLTARFDVTPEQLRDLLADYYRPEEQVYYYEGGRGGGPQEVEVTASRREGGTLELDYNILNAAGMDDDEMIPTTTGTITLRVEGEEWKYLENRCRQVSA